MLIKILILQNNSKTAHKKSHNLQIASESPSSKVSHNYKNVTAEKGKLILHNFLFCFVAVCGRRFITQLFIFLLFNVPHRLSVHVKLLV